MTLHFTTTVRTELGKFRQIWSTMSLKSDFFETLKTHGRLPVASPEEGFKLLKKIAALNEEIEKLMNDGQISGSSNHNYFIRLARNSFSLLQSGTVARVCGSVRTTRSSTSSLRSQHSIHQNTMTTHSPVSRSVSAATSPLSSRRITHAMPMSSSSSACLFLLLRRRGSSPSSFFS